MAQLIKFPLILETVTPLHIGSGEEIVENLDFFKEGENLYMISFNKLLNFYSHSREALSEISSTLLNRNDSEKLKKYFKQVKQSEIVKYKVKAPEYFSNNIKTHLKDVYQNLLIPGSSVKGAIRTILMQYLILKNQGLKQYIENKIKKELQSYNDDKKYHYSREDFVSKVIFGKDAQINPMKVLCLEDMIAHIDKISIANVKLFDLKPGAEIYGWKKMGSSPSIEEKIENGTPITLEVIPQGVQIKTVLTIDKVGIRFLEEQKYENNNDKKINYFKPIFEDFYSQFKNIANSYAVQEIKAEIEFLEKFKKEELSSLIKNYESLLSKINNSDNSIYLKMSWGIGWKGMTGNYLSQTDIENLFKYRSKDFGKNAISSIFPKTRRFIVEKINNREVPTFPLGWVRLEGKNYV